MHLKPKLKRVGNKVAHPTLAQKPTLSLQGNYAQEVLSYYLWGQQSAPNPSEIADEKYANRQENC